MKILFGLILIISSLSVIGAPCEGAPGSNHFNSNGSPGGFIASTASVAKTVIVEANSSVCDKAQLSGYVKIVGGSQISESAIIDGNANISNSSIMGQARITGSSMVLNSKVCQNSQINFNITRSDYYCQTGDDEPSHPGEIGKRTTLGVDSDTDGVRDDVEIWINNNTSNTPKKNFSNERLAMKQIAKAMQKRLALKDNKELSNQYSKEFLKGLDCLELLAGSVYFEEFKGEIQVIQHNTIERLRAWAKTQDNLSGDVLEPSNKSVKRSCNFEVI